MHEIHEGAAFRLTSGSLLFNVRNLFFRYSNDIPALFGVNADISPGDRIALVGKNGSGKTTLIKLLCGLLAPEDGEVRYKGKPLAGQRLEQARLELGVLFQDPDDQLFMHTVIEDAAFGPGQQGKSQKEAQLAAIKALHQVGLEKMAYKAPHNLSFGQKKRAALAGLLAMNPEVLLLDEPTANLDPNQEQVFLDLLKNFTGTLICISHDLIFLYELCDRAVVIDQGRIHHDYTLRELVSQRHTLREHGLDFSFRLVMTPSAPDPDSEVIENTLSQSAPASEKTEDPPIVELHGFQYRYPDGTLALQNVTFSIRKGERISIVGENGAGKSTLLSCLVGLLQGKGDYRFAGKTVTRKECKRLWRRVGIVFQDCADQLFCSSVKEELAFGLHRLGYSRSETEPRVCRALSMVRLEGFEDRVPLHLSGGERKRLALACVLIMEPELLILDEPTAGLDPQGEELLLNILYNLDVTLVLVSHDVFFMKELTRRTLVMHQGKILEDLPIQTFMQDDRLGDLNGLSYMYRLRSSRDIRILQHEHEHSHPHTHLHTHPHRHENLVHEHTHAHEHDHPHRFVHRHPGEEKKHDHMPRRYHHHDHSDHDRESHDHSHENNNTDK
ncbi:MAG: ATP-binding cassette domain-containing protein [Desulfobacteraceae bacterium]|nr:ATP-binding cassette domain-containing protein [Desulfobacteraceae bacterium]